jgi:uncharacterized repeat protein (TIGR03803 family)
MTIRFMRVLGAVVSTFAFVLPAHATSFKTLYALSGNDGGQAPNAALVQSGKMFYSTTYGGGKSFAGTIFSFDPANGKTTTIYSFAGGSDGQHPQSTLTAFGGRLYGTTNDGGISGNGTAFSFDPATGSKATYAFTGAADGSHPQGLTELGGLFYGSTSSGGGFGNGTVFKIDPATGIETTLHAFAGGNDGTTPYGSLLVVGKQLFGVTYLGGAFNAGTVFQIDTSGNYKVLYMFPGGDSGGTPYANLTQIAGKLYGTTLGYGSYGAGTVFEIDARTGKEKTVYAFTGNADGGFPYGDVVDVDGKLYGTTCTSYANGISGGGSIYAIDIATGAETTLYNFAGYELTGSTGNCPLAGLVKNGSVLYGTAAYGGASNGGTVFAFDTATNAFSVLHNFPGSAGSNSNSALIDFKGALLGTSSTAGAQGNGTVFRVNRLLGSEKTLHAFTGGADGSVPQAALLDVAGTLYGTTSGPQGTIFSLNASTGTETPLYTFSFAYENNPQAPLIDVGGILYGTTYGAYGYYQDEGTVFSYDPATGKGSTLYRFTDGADGAFPKAGLVYVNGTLYGTASGLVPGGNAGTIFGINLITHAHTTYYTFDTTHGANPVGTMVQVGSLLYGTTIKGGASGAGSVFSFDPVSGNVATIYSFTGGTDGSAPQSGLTLFKGKLIGTASKGGAGGAGTVFRIDPHSGAETTLYAFTGGLDGGTPMAALLVLYDVLYGTSSSGGAEGRGTVFSLEP